MLLEIQKGYENGERKSLDPNWYIRLGKADILQTTPEKAEKDYERVKSALITGDYRLMGNPNNFAPDYILLLKERALTADLIGENLIKSGFRRKIKYRILNLNGYNPITSTDSEDIELDIGTIDDNSYLNNSSQQFHTIFFVQTNENQGKEIVMNYHKKREQGVLEIISYGNLRNPGMSRGNKTAYELGFTLPLREEPENIANTLIKIVNEFSPVIQQAIKF
jgi:hypothetical protein